MKFIRTVKGVEFPERIRNTNEYINIRSSVRVDIRPQEEIDVPTGLKISLSKGEKAFVFPVMENTVYPKKVFSKTSDLFVTIKNTTIRTLQISPGQAIATMTVKKPKNKSQDSEKSAE